MIFHGMRVQEMSGKQAALNRMLALSRSIGYSDALY